MKMNNDFVGSWSDWLRPGSLSSAMITFGAGRWGMILSMTPVSSESVAFRWVLLTPGLIGITKTGYRLETYEPGTDTIIRAELRPRSSTARYRVYEEASDYDGYDIVCDMLALEGPSESKVFARERRGTKGIFSEFQEIENASQAILREQGLMLSLDRLSES